MDAKLVEQITKLVVEALADGDGSSKEKSSERLISITNENRSAASHNAPFFERFRNGEKEQPFRTDNEQTVELVETVEEKFNNARSKTPARIGVGRTGSRPLTATMLKFRYDHAAAVDSVYGEVNEELLKKLDLFTIHTKVENEAETYILRPDLGRKLTDESKKVLQERCKKNPQVQIIVSNGLSAEAINANLENVYRSFLQSLEKLGLSTGTPFYIEKGRVGLMDDIGELLQPDVVVYLIGERPGLVTAESMSAYICYQPRHSTIESDRTVVSNIHKGGIPPVEAGAFLGTVIEKILKYKASGVNLVKLEE
jgi:ethanolamine ammonia-lyase small subunit